MRDRACTALRYAADAALVLAIISASLLALNRAGLAFPVEGVSMLPVLRTGDLALVAPAPPSSLGVGDVIVYRSPLGFFVIHRIIEVGNGYVVVKGDNNPFPDPWKVTGQMIAGRVVAVVDYLGYLALPPWTYAVAASLVALYVAYAACRRAAAHRPIPVR
ncbi:MAG: signal peptidase I [Conexivisphaera sp.]